MLEDLKLSQISSSPLPFRGHHSPGVRKHCQIIFARYFRKSSILRGTAIVRHSPHHNLSGERSAPSRDHKVHGMKQEQIKTEGKKWTEDVTLVEFMYLEFTRVPGESYRK